ncbi:MAG: hypothetical protein Q4G34_01080 [Micrococcus sp.]|nr:hypothetical protein [Micrococcus sp.]
MSEQLDSAGVARLLSVSTRTVYAYRRDGILPPEDGRIGRTPWWFADTITAWQANRPGLATGVGRPAAGYVLHELGFTGSQSATLANPGSGSYGSALASYGIVRRLMRTGISPDVSVAANGALRLHTSHSIDELVEALATADMWPIITTWSSGSGVFGSTSGKARARLDRIAELSEDPQWEVYAQSVGIARELAVHAEEQGIIDGAGKILDKAALVRLSIYGVPEPMRSWATACVGWHREGGTGAEQYRVSLASCTGGNAARSDWSAIYAACALACRDRDPRGWWHDLLTGESTTDLLAQSPSAFLDATAAERGLLNPPWFICAMEGLLSCQPEPVSGEGTAVAARPTTWPCATLRPLPLAQAREGGNLRGTIRLPVPAVGERVTAHEWIRMPTTMQGVLGTYSRHERGGRVARYSPGNHGSVPFCVQEDVAAVETQDTYGGKDDWSDNLGAIVTVATRERNEATQREARTYGGDWRELRPTLAGDTYRREVRHYLGDWHEDVGLEVTRGTGGFILAATFDGQPLSDRAAVIHLPKIGVWRDDENDLHVEDVHPSLERAGLTADVILQRCTQTYR